MIELQMTKDKLQMRGGITNDDPDSYRERITNALMLNSDTPVLKH